MVKQNNIPTIKIACRVVVVLCLHEASSISESENGTISEFSTDTDNKFLTVNNYFSKLNDVLTTSLFLTWKKNK
jgi:hypothetical protein